MTDNEYNILSMILSMTGNEYKVQNYNIPLELNEWIYIIT